MENLRWFFRQAERSSLIFVWNPRGQWNREVVASLCQELDLVQGVDPFQPHPPEDPPRCFWLHGGERYRHRYTDEELRWLKERCPGETYFLFNNLSVYDDARRFRQALAANA